MISIIIPCYEMAGRGLEMLRELLMSLCHQTYKDVQIVITDQSNDDKIEQYCYKIGLCYIRHSGRGASVNFNNGLQVARGNIIKPMFQDDQFLDPDCLQRIADSKSQWSVLTSEHIGGRSTHYPYPTEDVYELARGRNTYGSPSAVAWKRNEFTFDPNLQWLFDCDFYARMVMTYGQPEFLDSKVLIREWEGSATNTNAAGMVRVQELAYIENKYKDVKGQ